MTIPARLFSGAVVSFCGRIIGTALSIYTIAVITRSLTFTYGDQGIAEYGMYATVLAYVMVLAIIADGGLYTLFTRDASRKGADERAILERAWRARIVWGGGVLVVGAVAALILPHYQPVVRIGIAVGSVGVAFQLLSQLLLGVFQRRFRLVPPALAEVAGRILQLVVVVIVSVIHPSILGYLVAFVAGTLLTLVINIIGARRFVPFRIVGRALEGHMRPLIREAWPIGAALFLSIVFFKIDVIMLSFMKSPQDVGIYALPFKVLESLLFFPAAVGGLLMPVFSRASSPSPSGIIRPLRSATDMYIIAAIPAAAVLFVTAPMVVSALAGNEFIDSVPVLRVLAIALGVLFLGNLFGNAIIAIGKQRSLLNVAIVLTAINIAANFILIPPYSVMGAAWATLGTQILSAILAFAILFRSGVPLPTSPTTFRIVASGVLFVAVLSLRFSVETRLLMAVVAYVFALFASGALSVPQMRRILNVQRS